METKKMNKAKEILYKHAKNNGCKYVLSRNPFLEQAVLNAINEALTTPDVVKCPKCNNRNIAPKFGEVRNRCRDCQIFF